MSREKRDKWRDVLGEAEATHSKLLAVYEALNKENVGGNSCRLAPGHAVLCCCFWHCMFLI